MHWQPACCYIRDYLLQVPVHFEELKSRKYRQSLLLEHGGSGAIFVTSG